MCSVVTAIQKKGVHPICDLCESRVAFADSSFVRVFGHSVEIFCRKEICANVERGLRKIAKVVSMTKESNILSGNL